jgi:hypothetical protein
MPIVYACIVPITATPAGGRIGDALQRIAEELAGYEPELLVFVGPTTGGATRIGVHGGYKLAEGIVAEAKTYDLPTESLRRWSGDEPIFPLDVPSLRVAACALEPRAHFEFGRAAGRVIDTDERRIVTICAVELSRGSVQFDKHYRRALESWNVKSMAGMESSFRRNARERAVAQTALLMGSLGAYQVQARELCYEPSASGGYIVAAIDILGRRRAR